MFSAGTEMPGDGQVGRRVANIAVPDGGPCAMPDSSEAGLLTQVNLQRNQTLISRVEV
ncbi:hypothetical protein M233_08885 [Xylella fastidiosa subsp. multiplex Griffin-1]|nr:hypothetical protein M233_08885 [Xylella fastidiosa subsp. multiplex Griffin-1]MDS9988792.1 hypothetical protein [Xylella fastidiosa]